MRATSWITAVLRRSEQRQVTAQKVDRFDRVVVVFTRREEDLKQFDVALGPCIARPGRKRPFVGVTTQEPGDPSMFETLATLLLPAAPRDVWQAETRSGDGRLATFSDALVGAMADLNREALRRIAERPGDYDWIFEPERDVVMRWMPEVGWFVGSTTVPGRAAWFGAVCGWARIAQDRGQRLYCWSGPGFNPWTTPERIERLRARVTGEQPTA